MFFINFQVLAKSLMLVIHLMSSASVYKYSDQLDLYLNIVTSFFIWNGTQFLLHHID